MARRKCRRFKMTRAGRRCASYGAIKGEVPPELIAAKHDHVQAELWKLIVWVAGTQQTNFQSAMRDVMTDLMHLADSQALDFDEAWEGARAVYEEEILLRRGEE